VQAGADTHAGEGTDASLRKSGGTLEVEYEYGKRVAEVITAPGAVTRLTVGVVVPPEIDSATQARIRELILVAAGLDVPRGDAVNVQPLGAAVLGVASDAAVNGPEERRTVPVRTDGDNSLVGIEASAPRSITAAAIGATALVVVCILILQWRRRRDLTGRE